MRRLHLVLFLDQIFSLLNLHLLSLVSQRCKNQQLQLVLLVFWGDFFFFNVPIVKPAS